MAAYNRAHTLDRAIESVLRQTYPHWELVIVDDGSTDGTDEVLGRRRDERIRVVRHDRNRGVTAAKNTGFDHARGDWIATLDSDDEIVPQALAVLLRPLDEVDPDLDAVGCNCFDSQTGTLTGRGLRRDQFISVPIMLDVLRGEHWGMFHRRILGNRRFNERIRGSEGLLWCRIYDGAKWYYVHRGLRVYHTEGDDRLTSSAAPARDRERRRYEMYRAIFDEESALLHHIRRLSVREYRSILREAARSFLLAGDGERLGEAVRNLEESGEHLRPGLLRAGARLSPLLRALRGPGPVEKEMRR